MWPTATAVLHIIRGFAILHYMLVAHTMHENIFADVASPTGCTQVTPRMDLHHDAVLGLATKRDPPEQLDLYWNKRSGAAHWCQML